MLPSETMIWQPEFTDKTLSRKPGAVQKLTIPGLRAERKVISKLSPRSYLKRSLIPIKKIETKIDSVECISIHRVDS
ncbi:hypothetical protein BHF04_19815 [Escherichia coli]|nr:hypothetical protein BHF04_19815 [Escherichia coli]